MMEKENTSRNTVRRLHLCAFAAAFMLPYASAGNADRVMAYLYQNAPTSPSHGSPRTATAPHAGYASYTPPAQTVYAQPQADYSQPGGARAVSSYDSEVSRLKAVAHGSGVYRVPKRSAADTIFDIRRYIKESWTPGVNCWGLAAQRYDLNPYLLYSIALVESGMQASVTSRPNRDGTHDIGLMQINSNWLRTPRFREAGITKQDLMDSCTNIHVGAWVLKGNINAKGYTWEAIGSYNAWSNKKAQYRYATKVYTMYGLVMESRKSGELSRDPLAPLKRFNELQKRKRT